MLSSRILTAGSRRYSDLWPPARICQYTEHAAWYFEAVPEKRKHT